MDVDGVDFFNSPNADGQPNTAALQQQQQSMNTQYGSNMDLSGGMGQGEMSMMMDPNFNPFSPLGDTSMQCQADELAMDMVRRASMGNGAEAFGDVTMGNMDTPPQGGYSDFSSGGFHDGYGMGMGMPQRMPMSTAPFVPTSTAFAPSIQLPQTVPNFSMAPMDTSMQVGQISQMPMYAMETSSNMNEFPSSAPSIPNPMAMAPPPLPSTTSSRTSTRSTPTTLSSSAQQEARASPAGTSSGSSTSNTRTVQIQSQNENSMTESLSQLQLPDKPPASAAKPANLTDPYSQSGFNFLELLQKVVSRPNPKIDIGAVDMSCSFVVTDARKYDNPIVYVSPTFEMLTGYAKWEIRGRNCRFLQHPEGKVERGSKRTHVDPTTVYYFKTQLERGREAQATLLNYRKNGMSFVNLLTMIPVAAEGDACAYFVGFQIDLVDHPDAIQKRNKDGSCGINYRISPKPSFGLPGPQQMMPRQSLSYMSNSYNNTTKLLTSTIHSSSNNVQIKEAWDKTLLENTDSVIFVLSLKGIIQYCSQSVTRILGWSPEEWTNFNISKFCHPSDLIPLTRDIKETASGKPIDVIFRIQRKRNVNDPNDAEGGYVWFESHGALNTEQGKGKKCIFFSGRRISVYHLPRNLINISSVSDNELWYKISTTGILLNMSSKSKQLLDRESSELRGMSLTDLVRQDSKDEIRKVLIQMREATLAKIQDLRMGKREGAQDVRREVRHELQHKRGHFLQCLTTFYVGSELQPGRPVTFFIAETKFLKSHGRGTRKAEDKAAKAAQNAGSSNQSAQQGVTMSPMHIVQQLGSSSYPYANAAGVVSNEEEDLFVQLKVTRSSSWQFELRNMQKENKKLMEEVTALLHQKKKRKRRRSDKEKECANCHTKSTPEWRRGPSGQRDLCNSCGLRYAKLMMPNKARTATTGASIAEESASAPGPSSLVPGAGRATAAATGAAQPATATDTPPTPTRPDTDRSSSGVTNSSTETTPTDASGSGSDETTPATGGAN